MSSPTNSANFTFYLPFVPVDRPRVNANGLFSKGLLTYWALTFTVQPDTWPSVEALAVRSGKVLTNSRSVMEATVVSTKSVTTKYHKPTRQFSDLWGEDPVLRRQIKGPPPRQSTRTSQAFILSSTNKPTWRSRSKLPIAKEAHSRTFVRV